MTAMSALPALLPLPGVASLPAPTTQGDASTFAAMVNGLPTLDMRGVTPPLPVAPVVENATPESAAQLAGLALLSQSTPANSATAAPRVPDWIAELVRAPQPSPTPLPANTVAPTQPNVTLPNVTLPSATLPSNRAPAPALEPIEALLSRLTRVAPPHAPASAIAPAVLAKAAPTPVPLPVAAAPIEVAPIALAPAVVAPTVTALPVSARPPVQAQPDAPALPAAPEMVEPALPAATPRVDAAVQTDIPAEIVIAAAPQAIDTASDAAHPVHETIDDRASEEESKADMIAVAAAPVIAELPAPLVVQQAAMAAMTPAAPAAPARAPKPDTDSAARATTSLRQPDVALPKITLARVDASPLAREANPQANTGMIDFASVLTPIATTTADPQATPIEISSAPAAPADPVRRELDLARGDLWLDQLTKDIVAMADRPDRLSFKLQPEHLGPLDVDVTHAASGISIRMNTQTDEARNAIAAAQPRLIDDIRAQGIRVADAQVFSGGSDQQRSHQTPDPRAPLIEIATPAGEAPAAESETPARGRFA